MLLSASPDLHCSMQFFSSQDSIIQDLMQHFVLIWKLLNIKWLGKNDLVSTWWLLLRKGKFHPSWWCYITSTKVPSFRSADSNIFFCRDLIIQIMWNSCFSIQLLESFFSSTPVIMIWHKEIHVVSILLTKEKKVQCHKITEWIKAFFLFD